MAKLYKRGDSWYIDYRDANGRHRDSLGKISEKEAKATLEAVAYELRTGHVTSSKSKKVPRLDQFADDYLKWFEHEFPTSHHRVNGIVRKVLVPAFGSLALDQIKTKVVEDWKRTRSQEMSKRVGAGGPAKVKPETVNKELRQLRAMLNKAVEWEIIAKFPWPKKSVRQIRKEKRPPRFYSEHDLSKLYLAAGLKRWWWQLYVNTGMRKAEGLHLKWSDVRGGTVYILSLEDERTKSGEYRPVPLNEKAVEALKHIRAQHGNMLAGDEHSQREYGWNDDYVLPRVHINSLGRAFARDAARAGIGGSLHWLRHTFCTHLAMKGTPPAVIRDLAGHASMETTMLYMWSQKLSERQAVNSIEL